MFNPLYSSMISLSSDQDQIIAWADPASDAVHLGFADEGFADVTCVNILQFPVNLSEGRRGKRHRVDLLRAESAFHVLYISPIEALFDPSHDSLSPALRQLLYTSMLVPTLSEEGLDHLTEDILRRVRRTPHQSHAFYRVTQDALAILQDRETVELLLKHTLAFENATLVPLDTVTEQTLYSGGLDPLTDDK